MMVPVCMGPHVGITLDRLRALHVVEMTVAWVSTGNGTLVRPSRRD